MCVQVTKTANQFEISSLLEMILLKQVRWDERFRKMHLFIKSFIQDLFIYVLIFLC
jgi:hypothetical protein